MAQRRGTAAADPRSGTDWRVFQPLELTPLLAAALDAFYEHGFHGTSVRDIVGRVGASLPSLYYHHASKEGVFVDLIELGTGEAAWRVRAAAAEGGDQPARCLSNVIEVIVLQMAHRTRLVALDQETRHLSAPNRRRYASRRKEVESLVREILERGVRDSTFTATYPAETARALLGMCQSIARWYQPGGALTPAQLAERYVDIALRTVGVPARPGSGTARATAPRRRRRRPAAD